MGWTWSRSSGSPGATAMPAHDALALVEERPELGRRIVADMPDLLAEALFRGANEQAASVATCCCAAPALGSSPLTLTAPDSPEARAVAEALGSELGWDAPRVCNPGA